MKHATIPCFATRGAAEHRRLRFALALLGAMAALTLFMPAAHSQVMTQPITVTADAEDDSITVPNVEEAKRRIEKTAGGVDIVPMP
ncbi:MAG: hypothetical protein VW600_11240 [Ferrovibrio sp.]